MLKSFQYILPDGSRRLNIRGIARAALMALRGIPDTFLLSRPMLLARGARVTGTRYIRGAGILKLEDQVVVQGESSRGVTLGSGVSFGAHSQLRPSSFYGGELGEGCEIGPGTTFGPLAYIGCAGMIRIGRDCMFGPRVSLIAENHVISPRYETMKHAGVTRAGIEIGDDCWIGANVVILDGARIGIGCVIGASSVVRGEIPAYSIAVGSPARVVKERT